MVGVFGEYFFAKGWKSAAIYILKTVVDPSIASLSVSMFMFTSIISTTVSSVILGYIFENYDIHPSETPEGYGTIITLFTVVPCLLSVPFFYISGDIMRNIKRKQIAQGELDK